MHHLEKSIPLDLRTFDLKNFKKLPLWVVEYKALQLVKRIVVGYCAFFYIAGTICLYLVTIGYGSKAVVSTGGDGIGTDWSGHPWGFAAFTTIMAFTNTGACAEDTIVCDRRQKWLPFNFSSDEGNKISTFVLVIRPMKAMKICYCH